MNENRENDYPAYGRETLYAKLQQHIIDLNSGQVFLIIGAYGMGKSSVMAAIPTVLELENIIVVDVAAEAFLEADFPGKFSQQLNERLQALELRPLEEEVTDWETLIERFLPAFFHRIRVRQLIVTMDDAQEVLKDADSIRLVKERFQQLLALFPQLKIVISLSAEFEDVISQLGSLVDPLKVQRLGPLSPKATHAYLDRNHPLLSDTLHLQIDALSGGIPYIVTQFDVMLSQSTRMPESADMIRQLIADTFQASVPYFDHIWQALALDEQNTLKTVATLLYEEPLQKPNAESIERWLANTDYPMGLTTIKASLRSLEYEGFIRTKADGISIPIGLFKRYLIGEIYPESVDAATEEGKNISPRLLLMLSLLTIVVVVFGILLLSQSMQSNDLTEAIATVTFSP